MALGPDPSMVDNPNRTKARAGLKAAEAALGASERALGAEVAGSRPIDEYLAGMRLLRDDVVMATDDLADAKAALSGVRRSPGRPQPAWP